MVWLCITVLQKLDHANAFTYFSGQPGAGGPLPDLRAFPAIPESARGAPVPIGADPAGFGIFETVNLG